LGDLDYFLRLLSLCWAQRKQLAQSFSGVVLASITATWLKKGRTNRAVLQQKDGCALAPLGDASRYFHFGLVSALSSTSEVRPLLSCYF
jgi:hypothetical protein